MCDQPVDKTLKVVPGQHTRKCAVPDCMGCKPHPLSPEVDEIIPVSLGGDPLSRANCRLSHRICNVRRGNGTRTPKPVVQPLQTTRRW